MTDCLKGNGYLLRKNRLISPVRYRLRWTVDGWGRSLAEGEIRPGPGLLEPIEGAFLMLTEEGLRLPLEVTGGGHEGWVPFRRIKERELTNAVE